MAVKLLNVYNSDIHLLLLSEIQYAFELSTETNNQIIMGDDSNNFPINTSI